MTTNLLRVPGAAVATLESSKAGLACARLKIEQAALEVELRRPSAEPAEAAVAGDHTMARDNDGQAVSGHGLPSGPGRAGPYKKRASA